VRLVHARAPLALLHTDAVQGVPWLDVAAAAAEADLVTISAHKFGGPKGVGALVVRDGVEVEPLVEGGGQEAGRRAGTTNVAGVVGMAAALDVTASRLAETNVRVGALRDRLRDGLRAAVPDLFENGDAGRKVAGNLHVGFPNLEAETLLVLLDQSGVDAAAGSSCSSGATEPSHVLLAMGLSRAEANASIRLSLGATSTAAEVDHALEVIPMAVEQLRGAAVAS
jgi:cysteine desulfurase